MEDNTSASVVTVTPTHSSTPHNDAFENLFPALLECFAIIFAGYFAARISLISQQQGKGLSVYVSKFAMPALLFKSMCELKFADVDWLFLLSIFTGKVSVFVAVALFSVILLRPIHFGKVGIYGIFVTQSHDFALGIPIVRALYSTTHPEYEKYLYLIAPISVAFLNPIGFLLMEYQKWRRSTRGYRKTKCRAFAQIMVGVVTNPIVFMTALGIIANFVFKQKVPSYLDNILTVLGQSFAAAALFCLGHSMVLRGRSSIKGNIVTLSLLIAAKMLLSPLLIRQLVHATHPHTNSTELVDLSTYGFLYGTFPTAPTVYIYATLYSVQTQLMATGMVVSTFLLCPVMFISARLMTLPVTTEETYKTLILGTAQDISIVGVISCVWVFIVFAIHKRLKLLPHNFTICLVICQFLTCLGIIIRSGTDSTIPWQHYLQFIPYFVGVTGTRCWMSCVAVCLCLLKARSLCYVLKNKAYFYMYGFAVPILLCSLLFFAAKQDKLDKDDPCYMFGAYGETQGIVSVIVLLINIIVTVVALVVSKRSEKRRQRFDSECTVPDCPKLREPSNPVATGRRTYGTDYVAGSAPPVMDWMQEQQQMSSSPDSQPRPSGKTKKTKRKNVKVRPAATECSDCYNGCPSQTVRNIEDIVPDVPRRNRDQPISDNTQSSDSSDEDESIGLLSSQKPCEIRDNCTPQERQRCESLLQSYSLLRQSSEDDALEELEVKFDLQETRHLVLLLLLLTSSVVGVFLLLWRLLNETESGVFIELEFLDTFLMFGQAFFAFLIFGLDQKMVIEPFIRRVNKLFRRRHKPVIKRSYNDLDAETIHTCEQFTTYHRNRCKEEIVTDISVHSQLYKDVFTGTELVDWLIEVGLANERSEALGYGKRLLEGGIIEHISGNHYFLDMAYMYRLCEYQSIISAEQSEKKNLETDGNVRDDEDNRESGNSTDVLVHV